MAPIAWLSWSADSFARARAEAKPVLLSLAPSWCRHSRDMHRTTYADAGIRAVVSSRFVPIHVDADRRPDISERYGLGGWPTTAFLTSDGRIIGGGTYVDATMMADILRRVSDAFASGRHLSAAVAQSDSRGLPTVALTADQLVSQVVASFDSINGGFGGSPKFPHVAPVRLAIDLCKESGSEQYYEIAVKSLDAMAWGPLYDDQRGGFFSYCEGADWANPNQVKLLDVNASLLSLYVEALETLGLGRYGERAEDLLRYTQTYLADPVDGGWAGSQRADSAADAGTGARDGRSDDRPATIDGTVYSDWNAMMVSAALQAGRVLGDTSLSEFAIKSLERVLLLSYKPGSGVAHYVEDGTPYVRGLLQDQIAMAVASLDAFEATGNVVYEMMAQELASYAIRTMWDEGGDGFYDRTVDPRRDIGLLKDPVKPFTVNCIAARLLRRLAQASGSVDFADHAERTLAVMATRAPAEGPLAAEYVLASRRLAQ